MNKQYLRLADRPILAHTLTPFEQHPEIDSIVVISPEEEIPYCREQVIERFAFRKVVALVPGGEERQDSVRNGLESLEDAAEDDLVLIHDGVRPLVDAALISRLVGAAKEYSAALAGVPAKDTVKEVDAGVVVATPERDRLWLAQTPQAFRLGLIREAHRRAVREGFRATDDAMLAEWCGHAVHMTMGSYRNIKITTPEDLVVAEAWLAAAEGDPS